MCFGYFVLPAPGAASGGGGLAGRAQPLTRRYAMEHRAEAKQVESFITFITQNELIILSCRETDELHIKSVCNRELPSVCGSCYTETGAIKAQT